jgi:immune inhibitor A
MSKQNWRYGFTCLVATAIALASTAAFAMPPYPGDEKDPSSFAQAEALRQSYSEMQEDWQARGINQSTGIDCREWLLSTSSASKNILCILIDFPDKANTATASFFDTLIYVNQVGAVRHYYNEVSFNQLDIVTVELPSDLDWVTASNNYTYYTNGDYGLGGYPQNCQKLVEEAVDAVNGVVNYADYDNDGDGWVDGLMVVHAGRGAELTGSVNDIWSHQWAISPRYRDGKFVFTYSMMPEYWYAAGDMTLGVFCHELGHVFGLPDLYDTDYTSDGIGKWSLMAGGSWNGYLGNSPAHFDAWSRIELGFATYTNITSTSYGASIPNVNASGTIFRLWTSGAIGNEYYLVENRKRTGYDTALPNRGLLIWHVDDGVSGNDDEWYPGHTSYGHYNVALVQADNLWGLEKGLSSGDSGDPFPGSSGNTAFSPLTSPNSDGYGGSNSLVGVTNVSAAADTMTADFFVSFVSATEDDAPATLPESFSVSQNFPNPFNGSTRIEYSVPSEGEVTVEIFNILGQTVAGFKTYAESAGSQSIEWDGQGSDGDEAPAGIYFYRITHDEQSTVRKMLFLK